MLISSDYARKKKFYLTLSCSTITHVVQLPLTKEFQLFMKYSIKNTKYFQQL